MIVEENIHLVKMSSKSGNGHTNSGMTLQRFQNRINKSMAAKGIHVSNNIDLLSLKRSERPKDGLAATKSNQRSQSPPKRDPMTALSKSYGSPGSYKNVTSPHQPIINFTVQKI